MSSAKKILLFYLLIIGFINIRHHCQISGSDDRLQVNVTNILEEILDQYVKDNNNNNNGSSGSNSLVPSSLSEIIQIFVRFLVTIFKAVIQIFPQSSIFNDKVAWYNNDHQKEKQPTNSANNDDANEISNIVDLVDNKKITKMIQGNSIN